MRIALTYTIGDVAAVDCLENLLGAHGEHDAPATLFVAGRVAEVARDRLLRALAAWPDGIDVNTAGYRHARILRKAPHSLPQPSAQMVQEEVHVGAEAVRRALGVPCRGLRPVEGAGAGLIGHRPVLRAMREAGLQWSSTYLRGVHGDTAPGDVSPPFAYESEGFDDIIELPAHGWAAGALRSLADGAASSTDGGRPRHPVAAPGAPPNAPNAAGDPNEQRILRWPSPFAYPSGPPQTSAEWLTLHAATITAAESAALECCCLAFDLSAGDLGQSAADVAQLLLRHAAGSGIAVTTLTAQAAELRRDRTRLTPPPEPPASRHSDFDPGRLYA